MAKDARIKYVRQQHNLGPVANFQFVLDAASGEYFLWMSDDDWRAPKYIETLFCELNAQENVVLAFCDIAVLDEKGNEKDGFYSTYLPYLRQLHSSSRLIRLARFFLQDEGYGKANLVYGLMRRWAIKDISLKSIAKRYGFYGIDNLMVFTLIGRGEIRLADRKLYGITTGNIKHYPSVSSYSIINALRTLANQIRYHFAYVGLTCGVTRIVIALLFPMKLLLFFWHILVRRL